MTEKSIESGKKAGTDHDASVVTTDNLDSFRLALSQNDFNKIDSDQNHKLSTDELRKSSTSGDFSGEKQTAVDGLLSYLDKQPVKTLGDDQQVHKVLPNWHNADFAASRMTSLDFAAIDKDGDRVLSPSELKSAEDNKSVSDSGKFSAGLFLDLTDGHVSDERGIVRESGVNDFTKLDPRLRNKSESQLLSSMMEPGTTEEKVHVLDEVITRSDFKFNDKDVAHSVEAIEILQRALKENKDITRDADGKPTLGDTPLTDDRRFLMHMNIFGDLETMSQQIKLRHHKSLLLEHAGKHNEAIAAGEEAVKRSDMLTKIHTGDGWKTTVADLAKAESALLYKDGGNGMGADKQERTAIKDPARREAMKTVSDMLDADLLHLPADTRVNLSRQLLGFKMDEYKTGGGLSFDTKGPNFNPTRVDQLHAEAKKYTVEKLGFDPSRDTQRPHATSIFGQAWSVIDPKNSQNFYQDRNQNGRSDLVERLRLQGK